MRARSGSSTWFGVVSVLGAGCVDDESCSNPPFEMPPEPELDASDPPTVIAGQWLGVGVLELTFSKPIHAEGDLDPERFAVVGWYAYVDPSCDPETGYRELGRGYYSVGTSVDSAWIGPEDDTLLRVRLSNAAAQCGGPLGAVASGIMLAYTDVDDENAGPRLLDEDGAAVPDIGPEWAIPSLDGCLGENYCVFTSYFADEFLPLTSSLVPIPCP
jgi:hypothetical protein